jgi:hypothetical protein
MSMRLIGILFVLLASACTATSYFPRGELDPNSTELDSYRSEWYSSHLRAMSEPVLAAPTTTRTYRFTWLRSFHHPIAIRIVSGPGQPKVIAVELDGAGGYDPGKVLRRKEVALSPDEFKQLEEFVHSQDFWSLPSHEKSFGLDGAEWIIEGAADNYHVVVRWSPESGPVRRLGEHFISVAGWKVEPDDFY